MIDFKKYTHAARFAGGLLFGPAGLKLCSPARMPRMSMPTPPPPLCV